MYHWCLDAQATRNARRKSAFGGQTWLGEREQKQEDLARAVWRRPRAHSQAFPRAGARRPRARATRDGAFAVHGTLALVCGAGVSRRRRARRCLDAKKRAPQRTARHPETEKKEGKTPLAPLTPAQPFPSTNSIQNQAQRSSSKLRGAAGQPAAGLAQWRIPSATSVG